MGTSEAWAALQDALRRAEPSCAGDDRFTDDITPAFDLAPICRSCPVRPECLAFARVAPRGAVYGVWGGLARRAPRQERQGRSRPLTPEQLARIAELRATGMSGADIADRMDLGRTTVSRRLRLLAATS